jgi:hypothetical protein
MIGKMGGKPQQKKLGHPEDEEEQDKSDGELDEG